MEKYEEFNILPRFWGWVLLIVGSIILVTVGLLTHFIVRDTPRQWDFGQVPDIPGEHPFSTLEPPAKYPIPEQLLPLPFQKPLPPQ